MLTKAKGRRTDVDMTEGGIARHLITFAIPLLIGNLFQMMYNMVDTWVVGRFVSDAAFSAVGTLGSVTNLMIGFFIGLTSGAGVVISRFFGARQYDRVKDTVNTSVILTGVLCIVFTILGLVLIPVFLMILDMPDDVRAEALTYLTIWFSGLSGLMIYNMGSAIMRAVGDSRRPFIYLVVAAVTNTILDLIFVIVFKWGVAGVAIATIIAQGVSAILTVISICRNDSCVKLSFRGMRFHIPIFREILVIGFPAALQMTITAFSNIFVQSYINFFGKEVMGGWTSYNKIGQLVLLPMQSFALASTTFVGQNIGQNQVKRAEKGANTALLISVISTAILSTPIMIFAKAFANFFNSNSAIVDYGATFVRMLIPFYLLWCVNQIYSGALRGVGKSTGPMIIMLSSFVLFRQAYLFVVSNFISNTILPIAMAFPAGWVLSAIITFIYYKITGLSPKLRKSTIAGETAT
jgi:putative MATE family efflux protein